MKWKSDWDVVKEHFSAWWRREGMVAWITAPRETPLEDVAEPTPPDTLTEAWIDPDWIARRETYRLANTYFGGDALPMPSTNIGPGSLGTMIGSEPVFEPSTVWYKSCLGDDDDRPIRFDPSDNRWLDVHLDILRTLRDRADGRWIVAMPDLIENLDTLAALRGTEELMMDLVTRPEWVARKLEEINQAFFDVYDLLYEQIKGPEGDSAFHAFSLWAPGRTAKVQCDLCVMISEEMFRRFVVPPMTAQCEWLDFSMYHLDGEGAIKHLDALLEIDALDAVEWTPQFLWVGSGQAGGAEKWYDLYRRIRDAGKGVQAIHVLPEQVAPLLDEFGPEGMYLTCHCPDEATARRVEDTVASYR